MNRGTKALIHVVTVMAVITIGASLGATLHKQAQVRTPGSLHERWKTQVFEKCQETPNPDKCAFYNRITI